MENQFDRECMGIKFNSKNMKALNELFELTDDWGDTMFYESKETFVHDVDGEDDKFNYKYVIECQRYGDDKAYQAYTLYMVPLFESLCDKSKERVLATSGLECASEVRLYDIIETGFGIVMGNEFEEFASWDEDMDFSDTIVENMVNCVSLIDRMRGFYLDKYVNRIGTTGWDVLESAIHGTDMYARALGL